MDLIISALADIAKHYAQKYINTDDNTLNIKVIGLVSILITVLTGILTTVLKGSFTKLIVRYIEYNIFKKKVWVFPLLDHREEVSGFTGYHSTKLTYMEIWNNDTIKFNKLLCKLMYNNFHGNNPYSCYRNFDNTITKSINYDKYNTESIKKTFHKHPTNETLLTIGYINGYYIYLDILASDTYRFKCEVFDILVDFVDNYLAKELIALTDENIISGRQICEFKTNTFKSVGYVKPELTMDNYVSRYKPQLLAKLDAFRDGTLFKNNPYLDNNLGILLYGGYGTGKSYLVSAVANYLNRDICNVNFTKIKTKTEFRDIINAELCKKYVYCFDEFDYLLADILNTDSTNADAKAEVQFKIQALTAQLASVKDNKELSGDIIKQLKSLMEEGTSDNLTYPFILSELSGINSVSGRIIIATTNFIDRIPAALTRPGRFDYVLKLDNFNSAEIREILCKLYNPTDKELEKLNKTIFPEDKYTPAKIILKACEHSKLGDMIKYLMSGKQQ